MVRKKELWKKLTRATHRYLAAENAVETIKELVELLKDTNKDLRKDNKDLMDRHMSHNFEQYKVYADVDTTLPEFEEPSIESDEALAGEVIDLEKMTF